MGVLFKNADITLYNKYYDKENDVDRYQRTVIRDVNWQGKRNATVTDKGLNRDDSILIFIDKIPGYVSPVSYTHLDVYKRQDANQLEKAIKEHPILKFRDITIINEMQRKNKDDKISTIVPYVNNGTFIFAEEDEEFTNQLMERCV